MFRTIVIKSRPFKITTMIPVTVVKILESLRFDYEYDYEISNFWRQLLESSRADVIIVVVIAHLRTTFSSKLILKQTMTTTLSRQQEMTRANVVVVKSKAL